MSFLKVVLDKMKIFKHNLSFIWKEVVGVYYSLDLLLISSFLLLISCTKSGQTTFTEGDRVFLIQ